MPLIYITGVSGTGKSTVLVELQKQGLDAYGIDEEGVADWVDRETGAIVPFPHDDPDVSIHDWYEKHRWVHSPMQIGQLKAQSDQSNTPFFLVGLAEDEETVWHFFDKVIYLVIDEATLRKRIAEREGNQFGKTPEEMAVIFLWLRNNDSRYRSSEAYTVDAARPLNDVVDEIIQIASETE